LNYPLPDETKSPCIDAGDPAETDPDGSRADMGAYYYHQDTPTQPWAYFSADTTFGVQSLEVSFTDQSVPGAHEIVSWFWDFGDDSSSTDQHPVHLYSAPGTYSVSLTVTDAADSTNTHLESGLIEVSLGTLLPGGEVSGVWTPAGSPYYVAGDLLVPDDQLLDIDPGVRVIFLGREGGYYGHELSVEGSLRALGTEQDSILFTAHDTTGYHTGRFWPGSWNAVQVNQVPEDGDSLILRYCILEYGSSGDGGALILRNGVRARVRNTVIRNNYGMDGGGLFVQDNTDLLLEEVLITGNHSDFQGGGLVFSNLYYAPVLREVVVTGNSCIYEGGGMYVTNSNPSLQNVFILYNEAGAPGGGLYLSSSSPVLQQVTISGNSADQGGAIHCVGAQPVMVNSILWNDSPNEINCFGQGDASTVTVDHCDIQGGEAGIETNGNGTVNWLDGNLETDPLFVDAEAGDFSLSGDSPCIDAGTAFFVWDGDTLVDLDPEDYIGDAPDMGAFEFLLAGAPSLVITLISENELQLSWSPVEGAASYNIYSSTDPYSGFTLVDNTTGTIWSEAITGDGRFYHVRAVSGGAGPFSSIQRKGLIKGLRK